MSYLRSLIKIFNRKLLFDALAIGSAWCLSYWLRFDFGEIPKDISIFYLGKLPLVVFVYSLTFIYFGAEKSIWRFFSIHDLVQLCKSISVGSVVLLGIFYFTSAAVGFPRSILPLHSMLLFAFACFPRFILKYFHSVKKNNSEKKTLIIGAGKAGEWIARDLIRSKEYNLNPIGFIDDDRRKSKSSIHGLPVFGITRDIFQVVRKHNVKQLIIAIPSASTKAFNRIFQLCQKTQLPISTLPNVKDIVKGKVSVNLLREISLEDLLGREQVTLDWHLIRNSIKDQTILVTGCGGSIGSELLKQLMSFEPYRVIAVDNCEFNLFKIINDVEKLYPDVKVVSCLIDVKDKVGLQDIFQQFRPTAVFHAAAYKHVPLLEEQARVAAMNNIIGTKNLALCAAEAKVSKFVLVSTDKAVNPHNIMGATKRIAEIICQNFNDKYQFTNFITVRFGNVLNSAGSVIPTFKSQLEKGGPITVTHPDVTRFFMTIPEAAQLILQAFAMGVGGEIFVLEMGEPVKILHLAEQLIQLYGHKPYDEIKIDFIGLRPGEKLYEELFHEKEEMEETSHKKILKASSRKLEWEILNNLLTELDNGCKNLDNDKILEIIRSFVPELQVKSSKKRVNKINVEVVS